MSKAKTRKNAFCKQQCNIRYVLQGAQTDGMSQSSWYKSTTSAFAMCWPVQGPILLVLLMSVDEKYVCIMQGTALHMQYLNWQLLCLSTWSVCLYSLLQCSCHDSWLTAKTPTCTVHGDQNGYSESLQKTDHWLWFCAWLPRFWKRVLIFLARLGQRPHEALLSRVHCNKTFIQLYRSIEWRCWRCVVKRVDILPSDMGGWSSRQSRHDVQEHFPVRLPVHLVQYRQQAPADMGQPRWYHFLLQSCYFATFAMNSEFKLKSEIRSL